MTKKEILDELEKLLNRMEVIESECKLALKGYVGGAAELAVQSIAHVIDLVSVSSSMNHIADAAISEAAERLGQLVECGDSIVVMHEAGALQHLPPGESALINQLRNLCEGSNG